MVFEKKGELPRAQADFNQALTLQSDLSEAIAGRDRVLAAIVASAVAATPAASPQGLPVGAPAATLPTATATPVVAATPTTQAVGLAPTATPTLVAVASPAAQAPSLPVAPTPIPISRRVALIVANHAYPVAPLANPPVDAEMIKASLEKVGFSVVVKNDLDLDAFEQALTDFAETSKGADVALFYFAGHGFSIAAGGRQQNLLMSTSANFSAKTAIALEGGGEPLEHVEETIIGHARATLIFIDACRNVPVLASRGVGSRGFAPIDSSNFEGAYVVLSTRQGKTAEDGPGGQGSPFARAFASVLPTPGLRIEDTYARIREKVRADTHGEQVPDTIRSDLPEGGVVLMAGAGP